MKILSIGNSFSEDATRYLHKLGKACGIEIKSINLFIGGCPLKIHYYNALEDKRAYRLEYNGENVGVQISIKDALISDEWDYITVQQASNQSVDYHTYQPYLNELVAYIKKYCPHSKILVHQTWAYAEGSEKLCKEMGYATHRDMFIDIKTAYEKAVEDIRADGIIPCGEVFAKALEGGIEKIHRDPIHASLGLGRYALALTWLVYLTKINPLDVQFDDFDEPISNEERKIIENILAQMRKTI